MTPIYMIEKVSTQGWNNDSYEVQTIMADYGYFRSQDGAERFVESIDREAQKDYRTRLSAYEKKYEDDLNKQKAARLLGFNHTFTEYGRPAMPVFHRVITVERKQ